MSTKNPVGRPSIYDEEVHVNLLRKIFESGKGMAHFCAKVGISTKTFDVWQNKHKNFRKAYEKCLAIGEGISWDVLDDPPSNFNFISWKFKHLNQFVFPNKRRAFQIKDKSLKSKLDASWRALAGGHITPQEYSQLIGAIIFESKSNQPEDKDAKHDFKGIPDDAIKVINAVLSGKRVVIEE